jgi:hypothetical protein
MAILGVTMLLGQCYIAPESEVPPKAPSNLSVTIEAGFVSLRWEDNSNNETGFQVARRPGTGTYSVIQLTHGNTTTWDDYPPDMQFGTTYTYKVRSTTSFYASKYSNEVTITFMY